MDDDIDNHDPILKQVPLIKNPQFQTSKPITLNTNYNKLLPTLSKSVVPPKLNLNEEDLSKWLKELENLKVNEDSKDIKKFEEWLKSKQLKIAPGFDSFDGVMKPSKITKEMSCHEDVEYDSDKKESNELDELFGKTTI